MLKVWKGDLQSGGGLPGGASTGGGWAQRQVYRSGSSGGLVRWDGATRLSIWGSCPRGPTQVLTTR